MDELKQRIRAEGKILGNGILKIDSLINHQIDPALMMAIGKEMAMLFASSDVTRILTAEVSGIAPALATASILDVPLVYARKHKPITMKEPVLVETAPSHTKGGEVFLMVSPEFINSDDRVLVIDDFLASGKTIAALCRIVSNAGAQLVGIGNVVEKSFEGGRAELAGFGVPIESLVIIESMDNGQIAFAAN